MLSKFFYFFLFPGRVPVVKFRRWSERERARRERRWTGGNVCVNIV